MSGTETSCNLQPSHWPIYPCITKLNQIWAVLNNGWEAIEERSMKEKKSGMRWRHRKSEHCGFIQKTRLIRSCSSRLPFCASTLVHSSKATEPLAEEQLQWFRPASPGEGSYSQLSPLLIQKRPRYSLLHLSRFHWEAWVAASFGFRSPVCVQLDKPQIHSSQISHHRYQASV